MTIKRTIDKKQHESQFRIVARRISHNATAMAGMIIIVIILFLAIFAPIIAPYHYSTVNAAALLQSPSLKHLFGTDNLGRDCFSRILYGAKYSLGLGLTSVAIDTIVGVLLGSIIAYKGGWLDDVVMRFLDIINSIPSILLCIAVSAALGPGFVNTIIAMSVSGIPKITRMARGSVLSIRNMEYLEASESINCSKFRMIITHIIPNSLSPIIVQATMGIGGHIQSAAMLSFIGLGIQPPTPEWGAMLSAARSYILDYSYLCLFPGLMIAIVVIAFNWLGDGLRDALDPKQKK